MAQAYYESDSDSSDPDAHIKGIIKNIKSEQLLAGSGAGNYWPVTQTNNKSINRVPLTQCGLTTGPRENSNKTIQRGV